MNEAKDTLREPARDIPVAANVDLCVIGGSCTGVFAAVRAARLGLSVALVEQNILFGGMASAAQVNEWHSLRDATEQRQIIGGLTAEVLAKLRTRGAVRDLRKARGEYFLFNSAELAMDLDVLARSSGARLFLKAVCAGAIRDGNRITAALIEDKSGRRAIRARMFIDASGDGDLLRRAGFAAWQGKTLQPVNYQMLVTGLEALREKHGPDLWASIHHAAGEFDYPLLNGRPWINQSAADPSIFNVYGPRLNGVDASDADQYTAAVLEGRRCHRALADMMSRELGARPIPVALAHALGVRETWHANCLHRLSAAELLSGTRFEDRIGCGTYPVDVHSPEGTVLKYMDGREEVISASAGIEWRRWREESRDSPTSYHIPYRCLVPETAENLLVAGRLLDADREAFGGVRVMVNMNQTGEAAGTAAALAIRAGVAPAQVDPAYIRKALNDHGSLLE